MVSPRKPDFKKLIAAVADALNKQELPFMLIGGQAVLLHGQPRLTEDIDITLGISPDELPRVLQVCEDLCLEVLPSDVEAFVRDTYVLPAREPGSSIRIDFIFSSLSYERQAIDRAVHIRFANTTVPFASPEDLILHKLFSARPRDHEDIQGVVRIQGGKVDWGYIEKWAKEFAAIPGQEKLPDQVSEIRSAAKRPDDHFIR
ncbi:MAG: nucleotidyl transferase AbiEii/AbiGii toxin family protein [Candidatus Latescibacteria bacterium]|nr:nucleotidyl transferase AbiEii/AbiGii toxin family protein [Candidatus Latescibacterota bacterium]